MHRLVVGKTGSGKSRLAREVIVPYWRSRGVHVAVLDPLEQRWGADWQTKDPLEFLERAQRSRRCVWILDECRQYLGDYKTALALSYFALIGRNDGHLSYFLAQRVMQLPPEYRDQCSWLYAFQQTPASARILDTEYGHPELLGCPALPLGTFLHVKPGAKCTKHRLFLQK